MSILWYIAPWLGAAAGAAVTCFFMQLSHMKKTSELKAVSQLIIDGLEDIIDELNENMERAIRRGSTQSPNATVKDMVRILKGE